MYQSYLNVVMAMSALGGGIQFFCIRSGILSEQGRMWKYMGNLQWQMLTEWI